LALHERRLGLGGDAGKLDALGFDHLDAVEPRQEIEMPVGPAELAVGDAAQSDRFLLRDDLFDFLVLDRRALSGLPPALGAFGAGVLQPWRTQQRADMV